MRLIILFLFFFTQYLFSQEDPTVYENDSKAYYNEIFNEFSNERSFCDLSLFSNHTFSFYSRPHLSCSTWQEVKGNWTKRKNIYTFLSQYEVVENDTRFKFNSDSLKRYLLKFRTDKKSELKNRIIKIQFMYDFDSELDDINKTMSLNESDAIEIPFLGIFNQDKLASIRIEYQLSSSEKRYSYITENKTVNIKEKDIPNVIEIVFVEKPIKEIVYRTTVGKLEGERLEIISSTKTKPNLPEYLQEIGFEKYYQLRK